MARVAATPSRSGIRTSMSITSGVVRAVNSIAALPSPASPTTVRSGWLSSSIRNPVRSNSWSSTTPMRITGPAPDPGGNARVDRSAGRPASVHTWQGFGCETSADTVQQIHTSQGTSEAQCGVTLKLLKNSAVPDTTSPFRKKSSRAAAQAEHPGSSARRAKHHATDRWHHRDPSACAVIVALCMLPAVGCLVYGFRWCLRQHDDESDPAASAPDSPTSVAVVPVTRWDALDEIQLIRLLHAASLPLQPLVRSDPSTD